MGSMFAMVTWDEFAAEAPRIAEVFARRHKATGNLCLLATLRPDGSPRISPMEPRIFEGRLVLVGMPNTQKFRDLARDPRFELHTATVDTQVGDGDAKVWGEARNVQDTELHEQFAPGPVRGIRVRPAGAEVRPVLRRRACRRLVGRVHRGQLTITTWKPRQGERSAPLG